MQIKVKNTKTHQIGVDAKHLPLNVPVAEGKLVLVNVYETDILDTSYIFGKIDGTNLCIPNVENHLSLLRSGLVAYKPIIISETEKILDGDDVYLNGEIVRATAGRRADKLTELGGKKILALPEHFSPKHLQDIVDGKLKDGDKVLVECEDKGGYRQDSMNGCWISKYVIKLNSSNHITLHKVEERSLAGQYLQKIKEVCTAVDGNLLQMPSALQAINALVNEFEQTTK